jgi:hypothetical protein
VISLPGKCLVVRDGSGDQLTLRHVLDRCLGLSLRSRPAERAADAKVEPARVHGIEQPELLDDRQRSPVTGLDAGRTEPDRARRRGDQCDRQRWCGTQDTGVEVVLREPVPLIAEAPGLPSQIDRVAHPLGDRRALAARYQVEHTKRNTGHEVPSEVGRMSGFAWRAPLTSR